MKAVDAKDAIYRLAAALEELPYEIDSFARDEVGTDEELQDLDSALDTLQDVIDALRSEIEHALI